MSFWNTERIRQEQSLRGLIKPFTPEFAKQGAYELTLGKEAFITTGLSDTKRTLIMGEQLSIPPGQFALLLTDEVVTIPNDVIAFISVRFTIKRRGLINVSGFHVDPGYSGRLKFAVYNAGSQNIILSSGQRIFMMWFSNLNEPTPDPYQNKGPEQNEITADDVMFIRGDVASPAALKKELDELKRDFRGLLYVLAGILIGVFLLLVSNIVVNRQGTVNSTTSSTATPNSASEKASPNEANQISNRNTSSATKDNVNATAKPTGR